MKKYRGLCTKIALAAATCMLFAGCGDKEANKSPTPTSALKDADNEEQKTSTNQTPKEEEKEPKSPGEDGDGQSMPSGQPPELEITGGADMIENIENSGVIWVEAEDEERAKTEVIKDDHSGHLMYQGIYYDILDEECARIADYYDLEMTELLIPDTITWEGKTYRVTQIGEDVFSYHYDLEKLVLGNNVKVIEANAFCGCSSLSEIVFGTGLEEIGGHAFEGCDVLSEITLPQGLKSIGTEAFCSCTALKSITLPESLLTLGDNMFFDCESLEKVHIPASVETIPYGLFTNCASLSEVKLSEGLTVIEEEAFWACEALTSLILPDSLAFIGDRAFYNSALESITFPEKKVSIGEGIFDFCDALTTIYVSENMTSYYEETFGEEYEYKAAH